MYIVVFLYYAFCYLYYAIVPSPSVILNTSEHVSVLHTGDLALYTCNAMITNTHIHLPVHAVFKWTLDNLSIHSRERFEVSELPPLTTTNITSYHSLLTVAPVIRSEDEGVLMCSVFITEDISNEYILDSSIASTSTKLRIEGTNILSLWHSGLLTFIFYRTRSNEFRIFSISFSRTGNTMLTMDSEFNVYNYVCKQNIACMHVSNFITIGSISRSHIN